MNISRAGRGIAAVSIVCAFLASATAQAIPVLLVGGASDPYDNGFVPLPPSPPQPYSAADVAAMSDGSTASGYTFATHAGEFNSNPLSIVGFQQNFDFDVSAYEVIDGIDFSWTGRYELGGPPVFDEVSQLWLSAGSGRLIQVFQNGNDLGNDLLHTYTASWERSADPFMDDVDSLLHDGLASVFVQSEIGFTYGDPFLASILLDTREVSLNVRGTLKDGGGVAVPDPGTLPLLAAGLVAMLITRRRRSLSR